MNDAPFILARQLDGLEARLRDDRPVHLEVAGEGEPTRAERLVGFFRRWQFRIGLACYLVAVGAAIYFALQMARAL